jgi:hypothetical protein
MPVTLTIKGDKKKFPTPMKAIGAVLGGLKKPDSGVDALALGHAACVASAQAVKTNTPAGRRALKTLHLMTEAFRNGDIEQGIRLAVVVGLDSLVLNSRGAGISHPETCQAFEKAYAAWSGVALAPPVPAETAAEAPAAAAPQPQTEAATGEVVSDADLADLDGLFEDDDTDGDNDWADD